MRYSNGYNVELNFTKNDKGTEDLKPSKGYFKKVDLNKIESSNSKHLLVEEQSIQLIENRSFTIGKTASLQKNSRGSETEMHSETSFSETNKPKNKKDNEPYIQYYPPTDTAAILGFIFAILTLPMAILSVTSFAAIVLFYLFALLGLILSAIGLGAGKNNQVFAIFGFVLSLLIVTFLLILFLSILLV